jgi:hypothetical protein
MILSRLLLTDILENVKELVFVVIIFTVFSQWLLSKILKKFFGLFHLWGFGGVFFEKG